MYEPQEDSYLILEQIKNYAKGAVLDMGTGSGILAAEASKYCDTVIAADIDNDAVNFCKNTITDPKITFIQSGLFENIKGKFNLIIFNPPYLPEEKETKDVALDGGEKGYEIVERFFSKVKDHLKEEGKILIVFSSLTKKRKVDSIIKENNFKSEQLASKKMFFEEIYVYLVS